MLLTHAEGSVRGFRNVRGLLYGRWVSLCGNSGLEETGENHKINKVGGWLSVLEGENG